MSQFIRAVNEQFYRKSEFNIFRIQPEYEDVEYETDANGYPEPLEEPKLTGKYQITGRFSDDSWITLKICEDEYAALRYVESF
jgi:hypothetical protein